MDACAKQLEATLEGIVQENTKLRQVMQEGFAALNVRFDRLLALSEKKDPSMKLFNGACKLGIDNPMKSKINWPQVLKEEVDDGVETAPSVSVTAPPANVPHPLTPAATLQVEVLLKANLP
ncbi:unnamed protein product [Linum trigynum]|uniref:Uncharacterized protein n=1 Tax=Linum trigynum TaxID=586398 RepID=A0AAV2GC82_9ROSI